MIAAMATRHSAEDSAKASAKAYPVGARTDVTRTELEALVLS